MHKHKRERSLLLELKILVENQVNRRGLLAEHGLSMLINIDGFYVLFDTGQTGVFAYNAEQDGIDLRCVDAVVLSHGHYDHTGGLPVFCRLNKDALVYVHQEAFYERFNSSQGKLLGKNIGIPWLRENIDDFKHRIRTNAKPVQIQKNVVLSGEVARTVHFEDDKSNFLLKKDEKLVADRVWDEQFLLVKGDKGIYIFVGCSHPGIINCIQSAKSLFPNEEIAAVIGGMHLKNIGSARLEATIQRFKELGVKMIVPLHCTGLQAVWEMKKALQERITIPVCGDHLVLET